MKRYVKQTPQQDDTTTIHVTMYLHPIIYQGSKFLKDIQTPIASSGYLGKDEKYHTTVNPERVINGPLSAYGEELENPVAEEWESFVEDCKWLIKELGFTIIKSERSNVSNKSEYVLLYGLEDEPCGTLVYDFRISDHPFDAVFPEEYKKAALEYLKTENILDGSATEAGIDFQVEKVTVGTVRYDTWERAYNRLYILLKKVRKNIRIRYKDRDN